MEQYRTSKKQERRQAILQIIKKVVSWAIAIPALMIAGSESKDANCFWVQLAAILALVVILKWNHAFDDLSNSHYGRE